MSPFSGCCPTLLPAGAETTAAAWKEDYCRLKDQNSYCLPHRGEAPGPVKNGVNFSSYGKAKSGLSMATERVLKGGNAEHAISDPLFVGTRSPTNYTYGFHHTKPHISIRKLSILTRSYMFMNLHPTQNLRVLTHVLLLSGTKAALCRNSINANAAK